MKPITVMLADDHAMVREGFRKLLEADPDLLVIGEAADGRKAVALARKLRPDVILMDITMPGLNGLEATGQIRRANPGAKVLILSAHADDAYVERALSLGAVGFLLKQTSSTDLAKAIRAAHNGKSFFSPAVSPRFRARQRKAAAQADRRAAGGDRAGWSERAVGRLMHEGLPKQQMAADLGLSLAEVERHQRTLKRRVTLAAARAILPTMA